MLWIAIYIPELSLQIAARNHVDTEALVIATGAERRPIVQSANQIAAARGITPGMTIAAAVDAMLDQLGRDFDADVGFIAIDANGVPYGNHRTRDMPHAYFSGTSAIVAKMRVEK